MKPPGFVRQAARLAWLFPVALAAAIPSAADPGRSDVGGARRFTAELDAFFLTGEYGAAETTDIVYAPIILRAWGERHEFSVVIPYLRIDGPAGVVGGERGGVPASGELAGEAESRSGPGDVVLRGELFFLTGDARRRPWLSGLGRIKLPTADETKGLGTGEIDLTLGASWTQPWGRVLSSFVDLARKRVGDPEGVRFQDTSALALGLSARFTDRLSAYLMYDREDSIVRGLADGESLTAGVLRQWPNRFRLSGSVLAGLSQTREDWGVMIGFGRTWDVPRVPGPECRTRAAPGRRLGDRLRAAVGCARLHAGCATWG